MGGGGGGGGVNSLNGCGHRKKPRALSGISFLYDFKR